MTAKKGRPIQTPETERNSMHTPKSNDNPIQTTEMKRKLHSYPPKNPENPSQTTAKTMKIKKSPFRMGIPF